MLATDGLADIRHEALLYSQPIFEKTVGKEFRRLVNVTSASNKPAHRWLERLGFVLGPELPGAGLNGEDLLVLSKDL